MVLIRVAVGACVFLALHSRYCNFATAAELHGIEQARKKYDGRRQNRRQGPTAADMRGAGKRPVINNKNRDKGTFDTNNNLKKNSARQLTDVASAAGGDRGMVGLGVATPSLGDRLGVNEEEDIEQKRLRTHASGYYLQDDSSAQPIELTLLDQLTEKAAVETKADSTKAAKSNKSSKTASPSVSPAPSKSPEPSMVPTSHPSKEPSIEPTTSSPPSEAPTESPSSHPSEMPSFAPSGKPSGLPTSAPTESPQPSTSAQPTGSKSHKSAKSKAV